MNKLFIENKIKLFLLIVILIIILIICIYYFINKIYIYEGFYETVEEIFVLNSNNIPSESTWTVPNGVSSAEFTVIGGHGIGGNYTFGRGAKITTRLNTISGEQYNIYVPNYNYSYDRTQNPFGRHHGGKGANYNITYLRGANGGSATVVYKNGIAIIIAGGGGGGGGSWSTITSPEGRGGNAGDTNLNGTGSNRITIEPAYNAIVGGTGGTTISGDGGIGTQVTISGKIFNGGGGGGGLKGGDGGAGGGGGAGSSFVIPSGVASSISNADLSEFPSVMIKYNKPIPTTTEPTTTTTLPTTTTTMPTTTTTLPTTTTTLPTTTTTLPTTTTTLPTTTTTLPTTTTTLPTTTTTLPTTTTTLPTTTTTLPTTTTTLPTTTTTTMPTTTTTMPTTTTTMPTTTTTMPTTTTTMPTTTTTMPTTTTTMPTTTTIPITTLPPTTTTYPSFTQENLNNNYDDYNIGMMLKGMNNKNNLNDFIAKNTLLGNNLYISPMNQSGNVEDNNYENNIINKTKKNKIINSTFTPIIEYE